MLDIWTVLRNDRFQPRLTFMINSDIENSLTGVQQESLVIHTVPVWLRLIKILCTPLIGQYVLFVIKQGLNLALVSSFASMRESAENTSDTLVLFLITMAANVII